MSEALKDIDLDKAPVPQDTEEEEKEEKQSEPKNAAEALTQLPNAPTLDQLSKWKEKFGEILVSGFSETELFVFRPLSRQEWVNLQAHLAQTQAGQLDVEEKICATCVLWASDPGAESLETKAGSLTTLHEQIMQQSNFMDPRFANSYVVRL